MDEVQSENHLETKNTNRLSKKYSGIFILIVLVVLIPVLLFFFSLLQRQAKQPIKTDIIPTSQEAVDVTKPTREIVAYIGTQYRSSDGFYEYLAHYDEQCREENGGKVCPFNGVRTFQTTNAWTSLGYLAGYTVTQENTYLDFAKRDMGKLIEWCKPQKEQCLWVLVQPVKLYEVTKDPELLAFLKEEGEVLLTFAPSEDVMLTSIEARELALLYSVTNDTRYLQAAESRLNSAERLLTTEPNTYGEEAARFSLSSCWMGLANIEISNQKKNSQGIFNTRVFLDNGNIQNNFDKFQQAVQIQPCIESYFSIYKVTKDKNDYTTATNLLNKFLKSYFDSKEQKLIYGEGGTIFSPQYLEINNRRFVDLTDSSYTAYLLSLLHNLK